MPPGTGGRGSYGHAHRTQEELYLVVEGTLTFKVGNDVLETGPGTAVRVAPETPRSVHNDGDRDAVLIMASIKLEDYSDEIVKVDDFWPE
jgi:mannose-6-phosphate isomerase-like protein (cupin superfamily)